MLNNSLSLCSALFGNFNLRGQSVEIDKQELTKLMHLAGHFFGRFSVAMYGIISVKPKFMRPSLEFRSNSVFFSQSVDPLFDFPCNDVGRKCLQRKFHGFAVHAARRIEMSSFQGASCLIECSLHSRGAVIGRFTCCWLRNHRQKRIGTLLAEQVSWVVERLCPAICWTKNCAHRLFAGVAVEHQTVSTEALGCESNLVGKSNFIGAAVGAVLHERRHICLGWFAEWKF